MTSPWANFLVALALGLLIGLERERSKGDGPTRGPAGIRTFALTALLGALAMHLGSVVLLATVVGALALLAALAHWRNQATDPGLTTEVALLAVPVIGALAMSDMLVASAMGVAVTVILAAKSPVHRFVRGTLTDNEVSDGLVFAIATVVIWPLLPDRAMGPYAALNPHTIWLLVILIMAIGAVGHVLARALGQRFGLPITGLASGFVSSIATIGTMATRAAGDPSALLAAVAGATLSTVATFVQLAVLLFAVSQPTLMILAPALAAGGVVAAVYGAAFTARALQSGPAASQGNERAFSIKIALILALTVGLMLVIAAALKDWLGSSGIAIGAALAGLVDTHATAVSVASLVASGAMTASDAVLPILAAMTTNAAAKIVMVLGTGRGGFAWRVIPGIALSIIAAWVVAIFTALR